MERKRFLFILFAVLILFGIFVGTAAAQNVDVSTMSNEELMVLLQSIMQKLEQDTAAETEGKESETAELPASAKDAAGSSKPAAKQETKKYSVYKNKKLVIGRMPDSWFIRKPVQSEGDSQEDENDSNEGSSDSHEDGRDGGEYILYDYSEGRDAYIGTDAYAVPGTWSGISGGISSYTPEYVPSTSLPAPEVTGGYATVPDYSGAFVK